MKKKRFAVSIVSLCLVLAMTACSATQPVMPEANSQDAAFPASYVLAKATYPEMPDYPGIDGSSADMDKWRQGVNAQHRDSAYADGLQPAMTAMMEQLLADNGGENVLCSPLNIYMALALLAECTDGDSRGQILQLLGSDSVDTLRQQANDLWNDTYRDDGIMQRVLASALWLNEDLNFHQEKLDLLAQQYYASSFRGKMGSREYDQALQDWLNSQTGGMLKDQIGDLTMDPATVLALTTTVYFKAKWTSGGFAEENTAAGIFHGTAGDTECEMMHSSYPMQYYWGDRFTAVASSFESGEMRFILPDEGCTPEDLLSDAQLAEFLMLPRSYNWENSKRIKVNRTIPKFDVGTQLKLKEDLQTLGITAVFDSSKADFSAVTQQPAYVSEATHGVRVKIDEKGCEAAAYTMIPAPTAAPPPDEVVDFTLDRPFLFVVTNAAGLPLFAGIVNQL